MKYKGCLLCMFLAYSFSAWSQGVGINVTGAAPDPSAGLDVNFSNKGFLPPRLTAAARDSIVGPAEGLTIYNTTSKCLETWDGVEWFGPCTILVASYPAGTVFCSGAVTKIVPVINPTTGKTWMDRNLGAMQAATSSTDAQSYGSLYQWGRRSDGHQCRTSATTSTLSSVDQPAHGEFILINAAPDDWLAPQNINLWQGANGVNNPCPSAYRLPTEAELSAERSSWSSDDAAGAFASPLKLPMSGYRDRSNGSIISVGIGGNFWSSTVNSTNSRRLNFNSSGANIGNGNRAHGRSVRCIKD